MKQVILLLLIGFSFLAQAQQADTTKIIGLHPAVGKTISRDEKIHYKLFPEYKDSLFESAQILKNNDTSFVLVIRTIQGIELKNYITTKQLDAIYYQIDDLENGKQPQPNEEYALTPEEKRQLRKQHNRDVVGDVFLNVLGEIVIVSLEALLSVAFSN